METQIQDVDYEIDLNFQDISRLFVLPLEDNAVKTGNIGYFFTKIENNYIRTYDNILKIATGQGHDRPSGCLLDYCLLPTSKKTCTKKLSKTRAFNANPKVI